MKDNKKDSKIINIDFKKKMEEAQASPKQLYTLYFHTKIKTTGLNISMAQASDLIQRSINGEDIKPELQEFINSQNLKQVK